MTQYVVFQEKKMIGKNSKDKIMVKGVSYLTTFFESTKKFLPERDQTLAHLSGKREIYHFAMMHQLFCTPAEMDYNQNI